MKRNTSNCTTCPTCHRQLPRKRKRNYCGELCRKVATKSEAKAARLRRGE